MVIQEETGAKLIFKCQFLILYDNSQIDNLSKFIDYERKPFLRGDLFGYYKNWFLYP
jgi:hypothetical protein